MMQPMGRIVALQYREAAVYLDGGRAASTDVLRLYIRTHEGEMDTFDLPNTEWALNNSALQFMALYGYQPTDLDHDSTVLDIEDDTLMVTLAPDPTGGWGLTEVAMSGGREALDEAEWFDPDVDVEAADGAHSAVNAPPGPDPSTGNRGGVDMEVSDGDSDTGVEVTVE